MKLQVKRNSEGLLNLHTMQGEEIEGVCQVSIEQAVEEVTKVNVTFLSGAPQDSLLLNITDLPE